MKTSIKGLMMTAAVSGLLGGTTIRLQASNATPAMTADSSTVSVNNADASKATFGKVSMQDTDKDKDKHSCKGKNDCKGKGGCKTGDNGCKAKNSCKGKGGCATDGSKPPQAL